MQTGTPISRSPTFNSYSGSLADIAARVVEELISESDQSGIGFVFDFDYDQETINRNEMNRHVEETNNLKEGDDDDDDDFEFITDLSPNSPDGSLNNDQIRPTYPVFSRNWSFGGIQDVATKPTVPRPSRLSLRNLMKQDRDPPSCSDDLDGIPEEMYCVWKSKTAEESEEAALSSKSKKSFSSIGSSSKRWKFRNFLQRSNSDVNDTLVRLPRHTSKDSTKSSKISDDKGRIESFKSADGDTKVQYTKSKGDRRRSVIPYRQDLVRFLANVKA
ncbi:uncharacterized protein LOC124918154 [Impatiens glandulifera]|uniref:uncharacterized protein LOC124918154 n=1 Tax=Impatiens glandulifera TaxID=253017 RepID=UPI001FB04B75|nr:uncharacterized protein LOC124918154 [Impatiens glandulifera]